MTKRFLTKCPILVLTFLVGVAVYSLTVKRHHSYLRKCDRERVYINGQMSSNSVVYHTPDGITFVKVAEDGNWYWVGPKGGINYCTQTNGSQLKEQPEVWHYRDFSCVGVEAIDDSDHYFGKSIVIGNESVEFSSRSKAQIKVVW